MRSQGARKGSPRTFTSSASPRHLSTYATFTTGAATSLTTGASNGRVTATRTVLPTRLDTTQWPVAIDSSHIVLHSTPVGSTSGAARLGAESLGSRSPSVRALSTFC